MENFYNKVKSWLKNYGHQEEQEKNSLYNNYYNRYNIFLTPKT